MRELGAGHSRSRFTSEHKNHVEGSAFQFLQSSSTGFIWLMGLFEDGCITFKVLDGLTKERGTFEAYA